MMQLCKYWAFNILHKQTFLATSYFRSYSVSRMQFSERKQSTGNASRKKKLLKKYAHKQDSKFSNRDKKHACTQKKEN